MLRVHSPQMLAAALTLGACQLFAALRFLFRAGRRPPADGAPVPSAAVVVACRGVGAETEAALRSLLDQDGPARRRYLFVVPSERDPAHALLRGLLAGRGDCALLAAGGSPRRNCGKAADLLVALEHLPEGEAVVFADADIRVGRGWLRALLAPLGAPGVSAATTIGLPASRGAGLGARLSAAWIAWGLPYLDLLGVPCGQSLALRRATLDSCGLRAAWAGALLEDLALWRPLRRAGRVVFVAEAMPEALGRPSVAEVLETTGRWMLGFRLHAAPVWLLACAAVGAKAYLWLWALSAPLSGGLLLLLALQDAAALALVLAALPRRSLLAAPCAPLLLLAHAQDLARSVFTRELRWGRRRYQIGLSSVESCDDGLDAHPLPFARRCAEAALALAGLSILILASARFPVRGAFQLPLSALDRAVPFVPSAIFLYLAHFPLVIAALLAVRGRALFRRVLRAVLFATLAAAAVFVLAPCRFPLPEVSARGLVGALFALVRFFDEPRIGCLPSHHVAVAWLAAWGLSRERPNWSGALFAVAGAVSLSTLLVKQHYAVDVPAGLLLAALAWRLSAPPSAEGAGR